MRCLLLIEPNLSYVDVMFCVSTLSVGITAMEMSLYTGDMVMLDCQKRVSM